MFKEILFQSTCMVKILFLDKSHNSWTKTVILIIYAEAPEVTDYAFVKWNVFKSFIKIFTFKFIIQRKSF